MLAPPVDAAVSPPRNQHDWSLVRRVAFRFAFAYWVFFLVLYLPAFFGEFLPLGWLTSALDLIARALVPQLGSHLLRIPIDTIQRHPTGSGDTVFDYVQAFTILIGAVVVAIAWSIIDRRRLSYSRLNTSLHVALRYSLAIVLLNYGLAKVFAVQYQPPQLDRYLEPFGNASPMGLLWMLMDSSRPYTIFTGWVETTAGILLFWRRTTTAGAVLSATALTNVVMLNFTYDVPVKLYSLHLLAMSLFVVAPEVPRLMATVLVAPQTALEVTNATWLRRTILVAQYAFIITAVGATGYVRWAFQAQQHAAARPPLYGIWDVDRFVRAGDVAPPLVSDTEQWRRIVFNRFGAASIYRMDEQIERYGTRLDPTGGTLTLLGGSDRSHPVQVPLRYLRVGDSLTLAGTYRGVNVSVTLHRAGDENMFLLVNRGFHWVQEYPFNR